jgi:hypothetical protein
MPSIFRHPKLLFVALRNWSIFRLGWQEAYGDGRTYDDDPSSNRSLAYDTGRDLRRWGKV